MRKLSILTITLCICWIPICKICSQNSYIYHNWTYLDSISVANSYYMLPPPPVEGSFDFFLDEYYYIQAKMERNTPRGQEAILDAVIKGDAFISRFTQAFGMKITAADTPDIYKLLMGMKETAATLATWQAKEGFHRTRPFVYYSDTTMTHNEDSVLALSGSYPSGHATLYHAVSLVLQEINPDRQIEIMQCGYERARSRLIVGAHWRSDVEAGRLMAGAIVARLHAHKEFLKQLEKAKKEFARIRNQQLKNIR